MPEFKISKIEIEKNPFIGLYLSTSEKLALAPPSLPEKLCFAIKETLQVEKTHFTFLANSNLVGLYSVLNSKGILLPAFTDELEIKKIKNELNLEIGLISNQFSAVKNNITASDKIAICNPNMKKTDLTTIRDSLDVEVIQIKIGKVSTTGSHNVLTNTALLAFNEATENEMQTLQKYAYRVQKTTVNLGVNALAAGIVANSKGALIGSSSSGFETANIYQGLSKDDAL